jgi:hypothetical protein
MKIGLKFYEISVMKTWLDHGINCNVPFLHSKFIKLYMCNTADKAVN